jgi:hypothetical protein
MCGDARGSAARAGEHRDAALLCEAAMRSLRNLVTQRSAVYVGAQKAAARSRALKTRNY